MFVPEREQVTNVGLAEVAALSRVLQYFVGEKLLEDLPMIDFLFDGALRDQTIHCNVLELPNTVCPFSRLRISGRVPVRVIQQHAVCASEVDPEAARLGGEDHEEDGAVLVEGRDARKPLLDGGRAIDPQVGVTLFLDILVAIVKFKINPTTICVINIPRSAPFSPRYPPFGGFV